MLIKAVIIFLGIMVIIAMIGNALAPGGLSRMVAKRRKPANCTKCGRPLLGRSGCDCGRKA